jgi:hypothetical protein
VNLAVAVTVTPVLRLLGSTDGWTARRRGDYVADEGDPSVHRLAELIDGVPPSPPARHDAPPGTAR